MKVIWTWSLSQNTLLYCITIVVVIWDDWGEVRRHCDEVLRFSLCTWRMYFRTSLGRIWILFGVSELLLLCLGMPLSNTIRVMLCCAQSLQSCLTLGNTMDCIPPGSSVCGILQAWILEWVAMPSLSLAIPTSNFLSLPIHSFAVLVPISDW